MCIFSYFRNKYSSKEPPSGKFIKEITQSAYLVNSIQKCKLGKCFGECSWSNGPVVKALDSQSTGWLQGRLSLSSFRVR